MDGDAANRVVLDLLGNHTYLAPEISQRSREVSGVVAYPV
jgi:hypothetical protein